MLLHIISLILCIVALIIIIIVILIYNKEYINMCFANSAMQCLVPLVKYINGCTYNIKNLQQVLINIQSKPVSTNYSFYAKLIENSGFKDMKVNKENDAGEFLSLMLNNIVNDELRYFGWADSKFIKEFCFVLQDTINDMNYHVPCINIKSTFEFKQAIKHFINNIVNENTPIRILNIPKIIILMVEQVINNRNIKLLNRDNLDLLNLEIFGSKYSLISYINHIGESSYSGHYIAYRRTKDGWYRCNEDYCTKINIDRIAALPCIMVYVNECEN